MIEVVEQEILPGHAFTRLALTGSGSVVVHLGIVKPEAEGRPTAGMRLTRDGDLEGALAAIERDLRSRWKLNDLVLIRRLGELKVGDVIMAVGVAAAGKDEAFAACAEAVRLLKRRQGLRKEELRE
jgi:molybdopterin synthase catalytic subunit